MVPGSPAAALSAASRWILIGRSPWALIPATCISRSWTGSARGFYCRVLGLRIRQRRGDHAAFVAAGDYHHHIGLDCP